MNRNDLRRVDMNLLVIFEALMFEKNLTRVAEKLFMGQPAVSAALGRLRDLFDDPLLLRNGRGMEPTPRALAILKELQPAMDTISGAVSRAKDFDPSTSCAVFRIGLSDDAEFGLFPPLLSQLREEAPGIIVVVRRANYLLMSALLASGEISVGVSYTTELPANAKRKKLRDIPCKVLRGDEGGAPLTLDEYCERPHAMVSFSGDLSGNIDLDLARIGRARRVVLAVPQFSGLRALLAGTQIIATVPDYAACALTEGTVLRAEDPPFEIEAAELSMVWSGVHDNDPAERWLRGRISEHMAGGVSRGGLWADQAVWWGGVHIHCCGNGHLWFRSYSGSLLANAPKVTKRSLPHHSVPRLGSACPHAGLNPWAAAMGHPWPSAANPASCRVTHGFKPAFGQRG